MGIMGPKIIFSLLSITLLLGTSGIGIPAFAGTEPVPFEGERNTVWVDCVVIAGGSGECSLTVGQSDFDLSQEDAEWNCQLLITETVNNDGQSVCVVRVPNFIDPLGLKLFHITTDFAEVDSIECISDQLNVPGSRDSQVPNGDGFIEEWRCEPNPVLEDIFFSPTIKGFNNIVIHTVSKDIPLVGGIFEGVDTTSLLVAGAQANAVWLIPVIVSAIGIGIVIARKF